MNRSRSTFSLADDKRLQAVCEHANYPSFKELRNTAIVALLLA